MVTSKIRYYSHIKLKSYFKDKKSMSMFNFSNFSKRKDY